MAGNSFIKLSGCKGESLQKGFEGDKGWIEIGDWSWEITNESNFLKGTGSAGGKATPGILNWSHYYDTSSPTIMKNVIQGKAFDEVEIAMCKNTGGDNPERFFTLKMKNVFIQKATMKGGEDGNVNQEVEMTFKEVDIDYKQQNDKGKLLAPIKSGWDITTNTAR